MENTFGKLHIKKRSATEWLIWFVFFFPFLQAFLTEFLPIPDVIRFLCDACLIVLFVVLLINRNIILDKYVLPFVILTAVIFVYTLIVYLFNYQSVFYYIWGWRNNFRPFISFLAFALLIDYDDAFDWFNLLDKIYTVNFVIVLIQFLIGYRQDYLGGIFGVQKGCNGTLLFFLSIMIAKAFLEFMRNESRMGKSIFVLASSLFISALAELKIFFIIFVFVLIISSLMTSQSWRKVLLFLGSAIFVFGFSTVLTVLYNEFSGFLSIESLKEALFNPNYSTQEDIGRLTAIPMISNNFLTTLGERLFGLGLGNTDSSGIAIFQTPFHTMYSGNHYDFYSYAILYLETGMIGLIMYLLFFVISFFTSFKLYKSKTANELYCQVSMIISVLCCLFAVYNLTLRTEIAYVMFFVLALPIVSAGHREQAE